MAFKVDKTYDLWRHMTYILTDLWLLWPHVLSMSMTLWRFKNCIDCMTVRTATATNYICSPITSCPYMSMCSSASKRHRRIECTCDFKSITSTECQRYMLCQCCYIFILGLPRVVCHQWSLLRLDASWLWILSRRTSPESVFHVITPTWKRRTHLPGYFKNNKVQERWPWVFWIILNSWIVLQLSFSGKASFRLVQV